MDERIVARLALPTVIAVQLGALATVLLWLFVGWYAGVPALVVSLLATWRALQTGFVLDGQGLQIRSFLSGGEPIPWARLRSVDVDEVVIGTNEDRRTKLRVRFMVEGETQPRQLIGCREARLEETLDSFRAKGLPATDNRPQG